MYDMVYARDGFHDGFVRDGFRRDGFRRDFDDRCRRMIPNGYRHPRPEPKRNAFLDTILVEDFIVRRVHEGHVDKCCEPMPIGVAVDNMALIFTAVTNCIEPDVYYTFDLPRKIDFTDKQVFIKAEPCGFRKGPIEVEKTVITVPYAAFPRLKLTAENLPNFYQAKYNFACGDGVEGERFHDGCDIIERRDFDFIEVDLDLRGNIATGIDFARNHVGSYEPDNDKYVLYMNNAGRFELTRSICTTRRFGDFH